jgi:hypothetical protein
MKRLSIALIFLAACGKGGGSTPEATFASAKKASEQKDLKTLATLMDPDKLPTMVGGVAVGAEMMAKMNKDMQADYEALKKKWGLKDFKSAGKASREEWENAGKEIVKDVKDLPGLFEDLAHLMQKHSPNGKGMFDDENTQGELKDVKIEGDVATGTVTGKDGKGHPIRFVRKNGSWYFSPER